MSQRQVPGGRRERHRWGLRLGTALLVAASLAGGSALVAGPAQAAPSSSQIKVHPEWVDGCRYCPGPVFWLEEEFDQRTVAIITAAIADGLGQQIAAGRAQDPAEARKLHGAAIASFSLASKAAGSASFGAVADWDGDLCPPWPWPWPRPHWADVEQELADSLTLFGQAATTRDAKQAAELRDAAAANLEKGAAGLLTYEGCAAG
jgi:hypothetical protein